MKKRSLGTSLLLFMLVASAGAETPLASYEITWERGNADFVRAVMMPKEGRSSAVVDEAERHIDTPPGNLEIDPEGNVALRVSSFGDSRPHSTLLCPIEDKSEMVLRYEVVGEVSCDIQGGGFAYLEMRARALDDTSDDLDRTLGREGDKMRLVETQGWRPFRLSCAGALSGTTWTEVKLLLQWEGAGNVAVRSVKLIQYRQTIPLTPLEKKQATKWGWIGVVGGGIVGLLGGSAAVAVVVRRARRLRREEELRRIASRDTVNP